MGNIFLFVKFLEGDTQESNLAGYNRLENEYGVFIADVLQADDLVVGVQLQFEDLVFTDFDNLEVLEVPFSIVVIFLLIVLANLGVGDIDGDEVVAVG